MGLRAKLAPPVVVQMLLMMIFGNFTDVSYSPLAPFLKNTFVLTSAEVGLITSSIFIGAITVSFFAGFFVDRMGPYSALKVAFSIMALGSGIITFSNSYLTLLLGYYAIGFGYGIVTPSTNSATISVYYPNHASRMGIKQSGVPMGAALAAIILPLVAIHYSLRYSFVIILAITIVIFFLLKREQRERSAGHIDRRYFFEFLGVLRNKAVIAIGIAVVFFSWGQQSLLTYFVLYEESLGTPIGVAEVLLIILLIGAIFGRLLWTSASERIRKRGRAKMLTFVLALTGVMFLVLSTRVTVVPAEGALAFILGMSAVGWNSLYVTLISEVAPSNKVGIFSGASMMVMTLGTIVGTPISGMIADVASYSLMWEVMGFTILAIAVIFLYAAGRYIRPSKRAV